MKNAKNETKRGIKGALKVYKMLYDTDKLAVILQFPAALLNAVNPYIILFATAYILDGFVNAQPYAKLLSIALAAVSLSFALDLLGSYIDKVQQIHSEVCIARIYLAKEAKNMTLDYQLLESPLINDIKERIMRDNMWGSGFWNAPYYLRNLLDCFFGFIIGTVVIITFFAENNISGGFVFLLILLAFAGGTSMFYTKVLVKKWTELINTDDPKYDTKYQLYFVYRSAVSQILKTSRIYGVKKLLSGYLEEDERRQDDFCKLNTLYSGARGLVGSLTSGAATVSSYLFVVARAIEGAISVSNVVRYAGTIYNMVNCFSRLTEAVTNLIWQSERIQGMLDFMEVENVLHKGTLPVEKRRDNEYALEFHNVSFKYPGSDEYALCNFSIKLNIGQKLAIVGMNGSGKTTMIKLLCRLYDPSEGVITLNGIDIKKYDYAEYMSVFSVVFQDFKIFSLKLSENIACSADVDLERAAMAIDMVALSERVQKMESGLDTYLYSNFDEGVEISGGEAQKIALARALYKGAPFIILDEPTAALDPIAEFDIYSKFNGIVGDKTAVYISHRLSSCRFCDDIAVFHEGELIQRGSHDALLSVTDGKYHELWNAQAQYYSEQI